MKKRIVTFLCFILIMALMLPCLVSCGSDEGETVFSYGDVSISENLFFYELALMKTELLQEYSGGTVDIPALWAQSIGTGVTFDYYSYLECQLNIKMVLYFANYALQNGGKLTSEEKKAIDEQMDQLVSAYGSKAALNKYLETYTVDYNMLREYYELYALYNKGVSLAFSVGGGHEIPTEDAYEYYKNNFITVKHIAIGTEYAGTDESGNYIYYTDAEKALKEQNIQTIITALENGEDFDKYLPYSEDGFLDTYPDGYTITRGVLDTTMEGYEDVAFSLAEGEWDIFELEGTSTYIIKRVPLREEDFENCYSTVMTTLLQVSMAQIILDEDENFYKNEGIIDSYNMAMIPPLS